MWKHLQGGEGRLPSDEKLEILQVRESSAWTGSRSGASFDSSYLSLGIT